MTNKKAQQTVQKNFSSQDLFSNIPILNLLFFNYPTKKVLRFNFCMVFVPNIGEFTQHSFTMMKF